MKAPKFIKKSKKVQATTLPMLCKAYGGGPARVQLAKLDSRLGVGVGAYKERTKLQKIIERENDE